MFSKLFYKKSSTEPEKPIPLILDPTNEPIGTSIDNLSFSPSSNTPELVRSTSSPMSSAAPLFGLTPTQAFSQTSSTPALQLPDAQTLPRQTVLRSFKNTQQLLQVYEELKTANVLPEQQKKLQKLMIEVIGKFKSQPKTRQIVAEIVPFACCSDKEVMQLTLLELVQAIKEQPIGNQALLEGLSAAIVSIKSEKIATNNSSSAPTTVQLKNLIMDLPQNTIHDSLGTSKNGSNSLIQGEIVAVIDILFERLNKTHSDPETQRPLIYAISEILEAMLLANVDDFDRKKRESMHDSLAKLTNSKDSEIEYYASIGIQILARTADDETKMHGALRRSYALTCGILTLSGMIVKLEFEGKKITEVYEHVTEAFRLNPAKMEWYNTLRSIKSLLVFLKLTARSLVFERAQLKKQIEQTGEEFTTQTTPEIQLLSTHEEAALAKTFLWIEMQLIEYEDILDPASARNFLCGCVRALVETTVWSESAVIHERVTDYLKRIILQLDFAFRHQKFQHMVIHEGIFGLKTLVQSEQSCEALSKLARDKLNEIPVLASSLFDRERRRFVQEEFETLFAHEGISNVNQLIRRLPGLDRETDRRLLSEARQSANFRIDLFIDRLRARSTQYALEAGFEKEFNHYIELEAKHDEKSQEKPWKLLPHFENFTTDGSRKIALLHGAAGAGKSLSVGKIEKYYWDHYAGFEDAENKTPVPLLIPLALLDDPTRNCVQQVLRNVGCQEADMILMQQVKFLFILDGYDEIRTTKNLFETNQLSKWKGSVIITCRTEALAGNYRNWFDVGLSNPQSLLSSTAQEKSVAYEEAYIMPFNQENIEEYLDKTHNILKPNSEKISYQKLKTMVGDLNALMTNPFILSIIVQIFERLEKRWQARGGIAGRVMSRAEVYEEFTQFWFEREERKLLKSLNIRVPDKFPLQEAFRAYSNDFAFQLFLNKRITVQGRDNQYLTMQMEKDPFTRFFAALEENLRMALSRMGSLVRRTGSRYGFIHKSLYEYFVAMSLWDELKHSESDPLTHHSSWNQCSLKDEISITHFLADCVKTYAGGQELLFNALNLTKSDKSQGRLLGKLGGNIMTVLHAAQVNFVAHFFKYPDAFTHITVEGAQLSHANFDGINFMGSSITNSRMIAVRLNHVCFAHCDLRELDFGEFLLKSHASINSMACRQDGKQIATGHFDGKVCLWDLENEELAPVVLHGHNGNVYSVAYTWSGKQLASGGEDEIVCLWDPLGGESQKPVVLSGHNGKVFSVAYSPEDKQLAAGSKGGSIYLWNLQAGIKQKARTLCGHNGNVYSVAYAPNGLQLAAGSEFGEICLWDPNGEEAQKPRILPKHKKSVLSLAYAPNSRQLASGGRDKAILLWNLETGDPIELHGHKGAVNSVAYAPNGDQLASGSTDEKICLWDIRGCKNQPEVILYGHTHSVTSVVYNGEQLISGSLDTTIRRWSPRDQKSVIVDGDPVLSLAYDANNAKLALGSEDKTIRFWDAQDDEAQHAITLYGHENWVRAITFSPDGKQLASCGTDKTIRLWNLKVEGQPEVVLRGHEESIYTLAYSPSGNQLASGSRDTTVRLWDLQGDVIEVKMVLKHECSVNAIMYSPTGDQLASGADNGVVRLWNLQKYATQQVVVLGEHEGSVNTVAYDHAGKQLASGSADWNVYLWNLQDFSQKPVILRGHRGSVNSVIYSSDNKKLASGSEDYTVCLWSLLNGEHLVVIRVPYLSCFTFIDTAWSSLVTGSKNGAISYFQFSTRKGNSGYYLISSNHLNPSLDAQACILDDAVISSQNHRLLIQNGAKESHTVKIQSSQAIPGVAAFIESQLQHPIESTFLSKGLKTIAEQISLFAQMSATTEEAILQQLNYPGRFFRQPPALQPTSSRLSLENPTPEKQKKAPENKKGVLARR